MRKVSVVCQTEEKSNKNSLLHNSNLRKCGMNGWKDLHNSAYIEIHGAAVGAQ